MVIGSGKPNDLWSCKQLIDEHIRVADYQPPNVLDASKGVWCGQIKPRDRGDIFDIYVGTVDNYETYIIADRQLSTNEKIQSIGYLA